MSSIIAFDPGVNGAFAVLDKFGRYQTSGELPRFDKGLNAVAIVELMAEINPAVVVIERVASRPGQGVVAMFTFGQAYGTLIGIAAGSLVPLTLVTPNRWKTFFRLNGKPKDASRELAIRLYPAASKDLTLKKHHGRADAILLARFVLDTQNGKSFA